MTTRHLTEQLSRDAADLLAGKICSAAALSAQSECRLLELIGEFDASGGVRWWSDVRSTAHWLSWACSMAGGTAREHVRVARALRRMPTVTDLFRQGRLSYSKVREVTRVVDIVDEARLADFALTATASQLARTIAAFRRADGSRLAAELKRQARWIHREDGMVDFRVRLPPEEAAVLRAALDTARHEFGTPPGEQVDGREYSEVDALLDGLRSFVDAAPEDRSGEDRTLVVVQVAAEHLTDAQPTNQPGGDVPAGTSPEPTTRSATCQIAGIGGIEPETARRLACHNTLLGAVVDRHGEVLALGRTRRLVSKAQRRALMVRDGGCQFPGCPRKRRLEAHHVVSWAAGGRTDLDNLVLLCRWHHTAVHEGGMTIERSTDDDGDHGWRVRFADGEPLRPWYSEASLPYHLVEALDRRRRAHDQRLAAVSGWDDDLARTVRPGWRGERFELAACVDVLFAVKHDRAAA